MFTARLRRYALGLSLLVIGVIALIQMQAGATVPVGTKLGDLRGELAGGEVFSLAEYRGEVVVLNFWATWCAPCRKEAPILSRLHREGVRVIGIAVDPQPFPKLLEKAEEIGIVYPIGKGSPAMMGRLSIEVVPTTYVIGRDGAVILARTGVVGHEELAQAIEQARGSS